MAAIPVLIPVDEYLNTMYRPDCDYIDGELKERNLGEVPHSTLQTFFAWYFRDRMNDWQLRVYTEQRVQVSDTRYRIPDVRPASGPEARSHHPHTSPALHRVFVPRRYGQRNPESRGRLFAMGVIAVWTVNPWRREAFSVGPDLTQTPEAETLRVEGTPIRIPVAEIFREIESI